MRKAFVLLLFLSTWAVAGLPGPLSGAWDTSLSFTVLPDGSISTAYLTSSLFVAYEAYGWIGAAIATIDAGTPPLVGPIFDPLLTLEGDGFSEIVFYADGMIGAFTLGSLALFDAAGAGALWRAQGFGAIALGGAQLYGFVALDGPGDPIVTAGGAGQARNGDDSISLGALVGAYGWAGPCWLGAEIGLGLDAYSSLWRIFYGIAYETRTDVEALWRENEACRGAYLNPDNSCDLAFTNASFYALFPFSCLDLYSMVRFDCMSGFSYADFSFLDIDLGLSWVELRELDVRFSVASKDVYTSFETILLDTVCVIPYVSILSGGAVGAAPVSSKDLAPNVIDGVSLDALLLEYSMQGITVLIAEMFTTAPFYVGMYLTETGRPCTNWLSVTCCGDPAPWPAREAIGIEIDGDSCCGASFSAGIYSFFTTGDLGGIFDWLGTVATLEYGMSESLTLDGSLQVGTIGIESLEIGFHLTWGAPPGYGDCCMRRVAI